MTMLGLDTGFHRYDGKAASDRPEVMRLGSSRLAGTVGRFFDFAQNDNEGTLRLLRRSLAMKIGS